MQWESFNGGTPSIAMLIEEKGPLLAEIFGILAEIKKKILEWESPISLFRDMKNVGISKTRGQCFLQ